MNTKRRTHYRGKRALDLAVVIVLAPLALVLGTCCAVLVKATSRGPVLFRQQRVGLHGEPFLLLKFRTMLDQPDNPLFPDPAHVTGVGRWLRRLSLDEVPQLVNVARGEMSIVGPRPTLSYQVARYDERQRGRLAVRPGVTGLAQIRGRNSITWAARIEHDLEYVERQSLRLDAAIMVETARQLVAGRGAEGHPTSDPIAAVQDGSSPADGRE